MKSAIAALALGSIGANAFVTPNAVTARVATKSARQASEDVGLTSPSTGYFYSGITYVLTLGATLGASSREQTQTNCPAEKQKGDKCSLVMSVLIENAVGSRLRSVVQAHESA